MRHVRMTETNLALISLANLRMDAYEHIGGWLREVMEGYLAEFNGAKKPGSKAAAKPVAGKK